MLSRRNVLYSFCGPALLAAATPRFLKVDVPLGKASEYLWAWNSLRSGTEVPPDFLNRLVSSPEQLKERIDRYKDVFGAFTSCTPSKEVLFDHLNYWLRWVVAPESVNIPIRERGQLFAWYWSYWGRSALLMWQATGDERFRSIFLDAGRSVMAYRDDIVGETDAVQNRIVPGWAAVFPAAGVPKRFSEITATGLIALPYLAYANMVPKDNEVHAFLCAVGESLWAYEFLYDPAGFYRQTEQTTADAFSHNHAIGAAFCEMYRATGDTRYKTRALEMLSFFRKNLERTSTGGAWWPYYPLRGDGPEPFWKLTVSMELPLAAHRAGLIDETFPKLCARAFMEGVFLGPDLLNEVISPDHREKTIDLSKASLAAAPEHIKGFVPTLTAAVVLEPFAPDIDEKVRDYLGRHPYWFNGGLLADPTIGTYARTYSYRHGLAI
jgi:hypothetical protein